MIDIKNKKKTKKTFKSNIYNSNRIRNNNKKRFFIASIIVIVILITVFILSSLSQKKVTGEISALDAKSLCDKNQTIIKNNMVFSYLRNHGHVTSNGKSISWIIKYSNFSNIQFNQNNQSNLYSVYCRVNNKKITIDESNVMTSKSEIDELILTTPKIDDKLLDSTEIIEDIKSKSNELIKDYFNKYPDAELTLVELSGSNGYNGSYKPIWIYTWYKTILLAKFELIVITDAQTGEIYHIS